MINAREKIFCNNRKEYLQTDLVLGSPDHYLECFYVEKVNFHVIAMVKIFEIFCSVIAKKKIKIQIQQIPTKIRMVSK